MHDGTAAAPAAPRRGAARHAPDACRKEGDGGEDGAGEDGAGGEGGTGSTNARVRGRTGRRKSWTRWLRAAARPAHEPVSPQYAANTLLRILHSAAGDRHHFRPAPGSMRDNPDHPAPPWPGPVSRPGQGAVFRPQPGCGYPLPRPPARAGPGWRAGYRLHILHGTGRADAIPAVRRR